MTMNVLKSTMLMAVMTVLLVFVGNLVAGPSGAKWFFLIALAMNGFAYWFSDKLILKRYRAQEVQRDNAPEVYDLVEELAQNAGLPMPKVYIIPEQAPNAFATGRNPQHAAVAVTEGILRMLSRDELAGVLGHELAHIKHRDMLTGTIAAACAGAIMLLASVARWGAIFGGFGGGRDRDSNPLVLLAVSIVAPIAALLVQSAISRSREFDADAGGAEIAGSATGLASALVKLEQAAGRIPMNAAPATENMFIVNPFRGKDVTRLFSTHPSTEERIAALQRLGY